ncbi:unnamed protein product [Bubo scandiacus]
MARRKAPQRRCQGASKGSLVNNANPQPVREAAGSTWGRSAIGTSFSSRRSLCTEMELAICFLPSAPSSEHDKAAETAGTVSSLPCHPPLASLGRLLLGMCIFAVQEMASQKKRFLQVILLLGVALAGGYCWTLLPAWSTCAKGLVEELTRVSLAHLETLRNAPALCLEETQKLQLLLEESHQLMVEISSLQKQAVSEMASEDWALESSGATIDTQRTSETYTCTENWGCRVVALFHPSKPPDAILQPDVSPGNCWPFPGHQGQVVIRLSVRVRPTAITVQHIYKEVSPSGSVASAPRDVAVFGVDADGEEEVLLVTFTYDVTKEAIQTFPLKTVPFPRAFSHIKFLVKSNWGNPLYTCIYRVRVHGVMAGRGTS